MIDEIKYKLTKWFQTRLKLGPIKKIPLETIGTAYGSWTIPADLLSKESVCYLAGAGEDISFDVGLAQKYQCEIHIFDPTPRAKAHWEMFSENTKSGKPSPIKNHPEDIYQLDPEKLDCLHFHCEGLWREDSMLKFYAPENPEFVSHSALNLQKTDHYFEAKVSRLSDVMRRLGHWHIDLLKLDIEGAEYEVIKTIIEDQLSISVICLEFDESARYHLDIKYISRIQNALDSLMNLGYQIIFADTEEFNFTLSKLRHRNSPN